MRRNHKILAIAIFSILIVFMSCQKAILANDYYMGMDANAQFSTPDRIELAATGLYNSLQNAEFLGGRALIYVDIRSNIVNPPTYFGQMPNFNTLLSSDVTVQNAWLGGYQTVFACNSFIKNLNAHPNVIDQNTADSYIAEACFIRGLVYFYMLNFWGQQYCSTNNGLGIPIVLEPADAGSAFKQLPSRATINDSYNQIVTDLKYAEDNLPAKRSTAYSTLARANKASARAILSRVYLYMKDYTNAINYANKVITPPTGDTAKQYALETKATFASAVFLTTDPSGSKEPIFFVAMNTNDNPNTNNSLGQHYGYNARKDISVSSDYVNTLSAIDIRNTALIRNLSGVFYTKKYECPAVNGSWVPVIRYAEILLNRAEATVKQNLSATADATALANLNAIRQRAGIGDTLTTGTSTNQDLLTAILLERWRELAFEGHVSFDAFRNGQGVPAKGTNPAFSYPNNYFALPIPQSEIQKNPNLKQNEGY